MRPTPFTLSAGRRPESKGQLALLCALLAAGCAPSEAQPVTATAVVSKGDLVFASSFYGEIEAAESHPIFVPEFRNVWQITVDSVVPDGTMVKKGDKVLTFAMGTFEEDLREKESELAVAQAQMRKVVEQNEDERISRNLSVQRSQMYVELAKLNVVEGVNLVSKLDLERARVELQRSELQLELDKKEVAAFEKKRSAALEVERLRVQSAEEKVKEIKSQLEKMNVLAPADGVLYAPYTRLNWMMSKVAPGKVVRPGDKVLEIPELDKFKASVYVRQRDAGLVKVGDEAMVVATMFPDTSLKGKVISKDEFATTRNERTGSSGAQGTLKEIRVVLDLEKKDDLALRPGGTVRADVNTMLAKDVLLVPLAALKEEKGGFYGTLRDGKRVKVKVGLTSPTHAEVLDGLSAGEELRLE
jgi:multidrug resistance efflux pump